VYLTKQGEDTVSSEDVIQDSDLVGSAKAGDHDAYAVLIQKYSGIVHSLVWAKIGHADMAEDICQEAFLVAFEKLDQLRNPEKFPQWIKQIAVNLCRRWKRDEAYRRALAENMEKYDRTIEQEPQRPKEILENREASQIVNRAVKCLGMTDRAVVLLRYYEGLPVIEIGRTLGISPGAVRKRLAKARKKLHELISAEFETTFAERRKRKELSARIITALPSGSVAGKLDLPVLGGSGISVLIEGIRTILSFLLQLFRVGKLFPKSGLALAGWSAATVAIVTSLGLYLVYQADSGIPLSSQFEPEKARTASGRKSVT